MSVLIKGLEMPKGKAVVVVIHPDGTAYMSEMLAGVLTKYLTDCEAIEIPPHGKLFDADKLIARLEKQRTEMLHELPAAHAREKGYTKEDYIFDRNGDLISMLRNQAAVIPSDKEEL